MSDAHRLAELERQLRLAQRDLNRLPFYLPPTDTLAYLQIIGGQTQGGTDVIQYASSVAPAVIYDPDVDTSYITGLGRGWLYDGTDLSRVIIRHDNAGYLEPLVSGNRYDVAGSTLITVASGAHAGETFVAYQVL